MKLTVIVYNEDIGDHFQSSISSDNHALISGRYYAKNLMLIVVTLAAKYGEIYQLEVSAENDKIMKDIQECIYIYSTLLVEFNDEEHFDIWYQ